MTWIKSHQIDFVDSTSCGDIYKYWIDTYLPTLGFTVQGLSSAPAIVGEGCDAFSSPPADDEFSRFVSWSFTNLMTGEPETQTHMIDWYSATNSYLRWGYPQNLECNSPQGGSSGYNNPAEGYGVCGIRADWNFRWDWQSNVYYFNDSSRYAYGQDVRFWISDKNPRAGMITQGRRIKWYWPGFTEMRNWYDAESAHAFAAWMPPMGESSWNSPGLPYWGRGKRYYREDSCGYYMWDDNDYRGGIAPHFNTGNKWNMGGRDDGKSYLFKNVQLLKSSSSSNILGGDVAYWGTLADDVLIYLPYKGAASNGFHWNSVGVAQQVVTDGTNFYLSTYTLNDTVSSLWFDFGTEDPSPELPLLDS